MIKKERFGVIVYYESNKGIEYLLLNYGGGHWDFPIGELNTGEGKLDAVGRIVWEHIGQTDVVFDTEYEDQMEYMYKRNVETIHKTVHLFLCKVESKNIRLSFEYIGYRWLPYDKAMKLATFNSTTNALGRATNYLE